MATVLFVCLQNAVPSQMSQALFTRELAERADIVVTIRDVAKVPQADMLQATASHKVAYRGIARERLREIFAIDRLISLGLLELLQGA